MKKNGIFLFSYFVLFPCFLTAQLYEQTEKGVKIYTDATNIEIQFYSPQIVRIIKLPTGELLKKEVFSIVMQPETTDFELIEENNRLELKSCSFVVTVNLLTGNIVFSGKDKKTLLAEKDHYWIRGKERVIFQSFLLDRHEPIYGLGQQQNGAMNLRGESFLLEQANTKIAIPFFQSVKGYGLLWDNYSATQFTDNEFETSFSSEAGHCIDYYFLYGESMDGTIACMRKLTGQVPMFPLWTWGYWQSKERYASQKELVETVEKYRDLKIPLDGIVQDWQYWSTDNAYWNGMEFKNPEFPDPVRMMQDIHNRNVHAIISVWPSFGTKTQPYQAFKEKGLLLDMETYPQADSVRIYNAYNSQARTIYWEFMNRFLFSIGIDGWWLDATEPEYSHLTESQLNQSTGQGSFRDVRNLFPLVSVGGIYDNERKTNSDKRVYILTRSAFAGQQRYGSTVWSGDIEGNWETLRKQIPAGLNFSLCALPYWNTDIGGFWVKEGSSSYADYRELYVRWLQYGAFTPMMRSHGTNTPREIWRFGQKGDWAYDAIEKYIKLRYRLLPYHYSLSWKVTSCAGSIMRMLAMDFPNDTNVWDLSTEYMYGQSFLVIPITQPFYTQGEKEASVMDFSQTQIYPVYLPEGADWFDFWTDEKFTGGKNLQRLTPVDLIPLYVKAGSIIPLGPDVQYAAEKKWNELELRIYPGADAEFVLYEDEYDNYNYENGIYSTIKMFWNDSDHTLTIDNREGIFPGMLNDRNFKAVCAGRNDTVNIKYNGNVLKTKIY
jgi:alpha-D-xyloside xylohydrolase